jgi:hypothetical protein
MLILAIATVATIVIGLNSDEPIAHVAAGICLALLLGAIL